MFLKRAVYSDKTPKSWRIKWSTFYPTMIKASADVAT